MCARVCARTCSKEEFFFIEKAIFDIIVRCFQPHARRRRRKPEQNVVQLRFLQRLGNFGGRNESGHLEARSETRSGTGPNCRISCCGDTPYRCAQGITNAHRKPAAREDGNKRPQFLSGRID